MCSVYHESRDLSSVFNRFRVFQQALNTESDSARALSSSVVNTSPKPTASQVSSTKEPFSAPSKAPSSFSEETVKVKLSSGREITARKSIIEALDAYEAFMDGYKDAMTKMGDLVYAQERKLDWKIAWDGASSHMKKRI